jgi:hypothetical protein
MRAFVLKFPLAFSYQTANVRNWVERFQQLCLTRDEWTREYQLVMTPSLMAFFLRDASDLLLRFEYLASTGGCCQCSHTAVFGRVTCSGKREQYKMKKAGMVQGCPCSRCGFALLNGSALMVGCSS